MATAKSLHIGLNHIDPNAYGSNGELMNCINDANSMESIARSRGFQTEILTDAQATSGTVLSRIDAAATSLVAGDIYLITYSGHGGQVPDDSGEEADGMNETWCLYDRQLIDDELYSMWSRFAAGVRIFITSDSCHSGSVVRMLLRDHSSIQTVKREINPEYLNKIQAGLAKHFKLGLPKDPLAAFPQKRMLPVTVSFADYMKRQNMYRSLRTIAGPKSRAQINCSLIFISGCQDNQLSSDGTGSNGLFTQTLLETWDNGSFNGDHSRFYNDILGVMPPEQTPNYVTLGINIQPFQDQRPYTIAAPAGSGSGLGSTSGTATSTGSGSTGSTVPGRPSVSGPSTWQRNGQPPQFQINRAGNPYFYFEITSDHRLFDYGIYQDEANEHNFWANWQADLNNRLTGDSFTLPSDAWNRLKQNNVLYYRIGTTSSATGWENNQVSVDFSESASAPRIQVTAGGSSTGLNGGSNGSSGQATGGPANGFGNSSGLRLTGSVGVGGMNRPEDVRLIQTLLNQLDDSSEGGPSPDLEVDGSYGPKTRNAIRRFQEANQLDKTGLILPEGGGFVLLKMKARDMVLCE
jgi:hypothetical protein